MKKNLTKAESLQFLSSYQKFLNIKIPISSIKTNETKILNEKI